jgi:FG-GAP-like repeat
MILRVAQVIVVLALFGAILSGCGGGSAVSSSSGPPTGVTGTGPGLSISRLAPSIVNTGVPQAQVDIFGSGFTQQSQVLVDGQPVTTFFTNSGALQSDISIDLNFAAGTHQFTVQNSGTTSNSLTYTVYSPQQGPFVMQALPGFLVGELENNPAFIVAADLNGDGLADVIMPGPYIGNSGSIAILNGQANGTLSTAQYVLTQTPYALAVGDVDGNGTPDLVSITEDVDPSTTTVSVFFGDGHGNFQPAVAQQTFTGIYPEKASVVDLDGDGKPDLLLSIYTVPSPAWSLIWLKNTGAGFAAPTTIASVVEGQFWVSDFNLDGKPDILYTVQASGTAPQSLHMLMNQGNGKFADQVPGGLNGAVGQVGVLDFNLDGIPDIVVQPEGNNAGVMYSFAGIGNGSFTKVATGTTPGPTALVTGDFDHDGFPDLAGFGGSEPTEIVYFWGDGKGNFTSQIVIGPQGGYLAEGDFNGDGLPDVVIADNENFVSLALGRTDRNFPVISALSPATITGLSTGDIMGNGLPDIFSGGDLQNGIPGTVFLNQGNGTFQLAAYTDPYSNWLADMTGKGVVDLLGGNYSLEIWPNNGTANFSSSPVTIPQQTADVTVADMDGDEIPDFVSATGQVFYGTGSYQYTPVTVPNFGEPYVIGDFNGDGKLDLAIAEYTFLNSGNRVFQQVPGGVSLYDGNLAVVGDFNGDGKDDIAINAGDETTIAIYYSNGDGTFYEGTVIDAGQYPGWITVGDFNGDGRIDLAVGLSPSHQVCLFFNSGNGQFTRSYFASGANTILITCADVNKDGKPDLIIGDFMVDSAPPNINVVLHQ